MADFVLPSKLVPEKITVTFDFRPDLEWGQTISSASVDVTVSSGEDSNPGDLRSGAPRVSAFEVKQFIARGIPGVIYNVTCSIVTNSSHTFQQQVKLAILPSDGLTPFFLAVFYTSRPYPIEVIEGLDVGLALRDGWMLSLYLDELDVGLSLTAGELRDVVQTYRMLDEALDVSLVMPAGELRTILISYSMLPEALDVSLLLTAGELKVVVISYSMLPEALDVTLTLQSGVLS